MHAEQFPKNRRVHPRSSGVQASILHLLLLRSSAISTPAASGEPSVHDSSPVRNPERLGETNLDPRLCGFYAYRSFNAIDIYAYFATPAVTQQISFHASTVTTRASTLGKMSLGVKLSTSKRIWLVTGCSQGFGDLFVREISSRGERVIATARNRDSILHLEQLPGVKTLQLDVTADQAQLDVKIAEAIEIFGGLDVLINNAGYVLSGVWEELS